MSHHHLYLCTGRVTTTLWLALLLLLGGIGRQQSISSDVTATINFIVIQPDDYLFFDEWSPPAFFDPVVNNDNDDGEGVTEDDINIPPPLSNSFPPNSDGLPNINRLREEGVEMKSAYAASTMCGTSRYSTLTGRYPSRSSYGREVEGNRTTIRNVVIPSTKLADANATKVADPNDCSENNLAAILQQNGYRTGVVGKWHLMANPNPTTSTTTDEDDESLLSPSELYEQMKRDVRKCGFDFTGALYRDNLSGPFNVYNATHNMEHVTSEAIAFIEDSIQDDDTNGFFLYFNPTVPHPSGNVTDALLHADCKDTVDGRLDTPPYIPFGMTADFEDDDADDNSCRAYRHSVLERGLGKDYVEVLQSSSSSSSSSQYRSLHNKMAGAVWVDDAIGSLFQTLEELHVLNDTFILFQLDHGAANKGTLFEGGSRIVQFVRYPEQLTHFGVEYEGLVSTIDIAPTILELVAAAAVATSSGEEKDQKTDVVDEDSSDDSGSVDELKGQYDMDGTSWVKKVMTDDNHKSDDNDDGKERCLFVELDNDRSVRCGCYKYISIGDYPEVDDEEKEEGAVSRNNAADRRRRRRLQRGAGQGSKGGKAEKKGGSQTKRAAETNGVQDFGKDNFYYLCNETTQAYISAPESSHESVPATSDVMNEAIKAELKSKMECLLKKTDPSMDPKYDIDCGLPLFYEQPQETQEAAAAAAAAEDEEPEDEEQEEEEEEQDSSRPTSDKDSSSSDAIESAVLEEPITDEKSEEEEEQEEEREETSPPSSAVSDNDDNSSNAGETVVDNIASNITAVGDDDFFGDDNIFTSNSTAVDDYDVASNTTAVDDDDVASNTTAAVVDDELDESDADEEEGEGEIRY